MFSLVACAQGNGLTPTQIASILGIPITNVYDFFRLMGQYLVGDIRGPWRLFHPSFAEFLYEEPDPYLDNAEGHEWIVQHGISEWANGWEQCSDQYYLANIAYHAAAAVRCQHIERRRRFELIAFLHQLAMSDEMFAAQSRLDQEQGTELALSSISLSLEISTEYGEYVNSAEMALRLVDRRSLVDMVNPLQLALSSTLEAALARAQTYTSDISTLWQLLIASRLLVEGRVGDVRVIAAMLLQSQRDPVEFRWSQFAGLIVAPMVPFLEITDLRAILKFADDTMLAWTSAFVLQGPHPDWAILPALWIEDPVKQTRAATAVLSELTRTLPVKDLRPYADLVYPSVG